MAFLDFIYELRQSELVNLRYIMTDDNLVYTRTRVKREGLKKVVYFCFQ